MITLASKIKSQFKCPSFTPRASNLVIADGYDILDKESARKLFSGKNNAQLLDDLQKGKYHCLEEWVVLSVPAMVYYASAYFLYVLETLESKEPDEEFIFHLLGALYQTVYVHKGSPFTLHQNLLIDELITCILEKLDQPEIFEYYRDDIHEGIAQYINIIAQHKSRPTS